MVDRAYKKANTIGDEYGVPLDIHTKEQIMAVLSGYRTDPAEIEAIALGVMAHEQKRLAKFKATHKRAPNYTEVHRGQQALPLRNRRVRKRVVMMKYCPMMLLMMMIIMTLRLLLIIIIMQQQQQARLRQPLLTPLLLMKQGLWPPNP